MHESLVEMAESRNFFDETASFHKRHQSGLLDASKSLSLVKGI
jgi:hypothetical protein